MSTSNKCAHLKMIQGVINRLSQCSLLLKACAAIITSAAPVSFVVLTLQPTWLLAAYIPLVLLWLLDGYYLWQERLYRALYEYTRSLWESEIDFSLSVNIVRHAASWRGAVFSKTLILYYGALASFIAGIIAGALL